MELIALYKYHIRLKKHKHRRKIDQIILWRYFITNFFFQASLSTGPCRVFLQNEMPSGWTRKKRRRNLRNTRPTSRKNCITLPEVFTNSTDKLNDCWETNAAHIIQVGQQVLPEVFKATKLMATVFNT